MKRENIRQVCPFCNNEFIIKDFDLFMNKLRDGWALASTRFHFKDLSKDQQDFIRKQHNEEAIEEKLTKGYIKMICQVCNVIITWESLPNIKEM